MKNLFLWHHYITVGHYQALNQISLKFFTNLIKKKYPQDKFSSDLGLINQGQISSFYNDTHERKKHTVEQHCDSRNIFTTRRGLLKHSNKLAVTNFQYDILNKLIMSPVNPEQISHEENLQEESSDSIPIFDPATAWHCNCSAREKATRLSLLF